jgi:hypothetical protein
VSPVRDDMWSRGVGLCVPTHIVKHFTRILKRMSVEVSANILFAADKPRVCRHPVLGFSATYADSSGRNWNSLPLPRMRWPVDRADCRHRARPPAPR